MMTVNYYYDSSRKRNIPKKRRPIPRYAKKILLKHNKGTGIHWRKSQWKNFQCVHAYYTFVGYQQV